MKLYGSIHKYIAESGGPEAFDPTAHPDQYAQLCEEINKVMADGDPEIMELIDQEELDFWAEKYLGIQHPEKVVLP